VCRHGSIIGGVSAIARHTPNPGHTPAVIARLAARQHGLVTMAQLLAMGLDYKAIARRLAEGLLHRVRRGVYAVGHAGLSREGQFMAAVLWAGEGAALSHLACAELCEVRRYRAFLIDVVAPKRRTAEPGVRLHRTRALHPDDVTVYKGIPVTTIARMLVDLTDVLGPYELANVIHEAEYRQRFSERATRDAMRRANGRRNLAVLEGALELRAKGSAGLRSRNEAAFLSMLKGLPEPLVNTKLNGEEPDFHWPAHKLVVEIDGPGHERARTKHQDARKEAAWRAAGYTILRIRDDELALSALRLQGLLQPRTGGAA
jgi:predicted transcriptional regulator of viral defense system